MLTSLRILKPRLHLDAHTDTPSPLPISHSTRRLATRPHTASSSSPTPDSTASECSVARAVRICYSYPTRTRRRARCQSMHSLLLPSRRRSVDLFPFPACLVQLMFLQSLVLLQAPLFPSGGSGIVCSWHAGRSSGSPVLSTPYQFFRAVSGIESGAGARRGSLMNWCAILHHTLSR